MALSPRQKLKILDGVCALHDIFTQLANSDTGIFPLGDDTGRAESSGQVVHTSYRAALNANTVHNAEGCWIVCDGKLTAMGARWITLKRNWSRPGRVAQPRFWMAQRWTVTTL